MQFIKLDQYQDNQGDICLRFYFQDNGIPIVHWLKMGESSPWISLSVDENDFYGPVVFNPKNKPEIISRCIELVGGLDNFKRLIKNGTPTRIGINLAIAIEGCSGSDPKRVPRRTRRNAPVD